MTITGTNFGATQGTSTVTFNGTTATPTSWSATSIVVAGPGGRDDRQRRRHGRRPGEQRRELHGRTDRADADEPVADERAGRHASVTITGTNFGATQGTSTVHVQRDDGDADELVGDEHRRRRSRRARRPATSSVTVGGVASNGVSFTVAAPPTMTSLSPTSGAVGTSVTITGTNFGATQGTSTVTFNGTTATPTSWSATSIVVTGPGGRDDRQRRGDGRRPWRATA